MAIDVYSIPVEERTYIRENLFQKPTAQKANQSIGVNLYEDLLYTQIDSKSYFGSTTRASVVYNQWLDFGVFCSVYLPTTDPIFANNSSNSTMFLNTYFFCGNTLGFSILPEKTFHPRFALDVGMGKAAGDFFDAKNNIKRIDYPILVLRPAVILDMNIYSFLQWTLGVSYRFQMSFYGPEGASTLNSKANWLEFSTGPVFNLR